MAAPSQLPPIPPHALADPERAPLVVRRDTWRYYPPFVYDISFLQWTLGVVSDLTTPQSAVTAVRADLAKVFHPTAPETVVSALMLKTLFDALLRALDLPAGSEVLWSGISIPHMVMIAEHHGLVSRAFDVHMPTFTPDVEAAERCINEKTKLMMITPALGRPLRHVKELVALARRRGILCFLDAAHSIAFKDELFAFEADVTGFSFGCIKFCTAIDGAIGVFRDPILAQKVAAAEASLPTRSLKFHIGHNLAHLFVMLIDDPLTFGLLRKLLHACGAHLGSVTDTEGQVLLPPSQLVAQIRYRPRIGTLKLLHHRLSHFDPEAFQTRCSAGWDFLSRLPNYIQVGSGGDPEHPDSCSFWLFPMPCEDPATVLHSLQAQGFNAGLVSSWMRATGTADETPQCHAFFSRLVYLPVYPEMRDTERDRLIKVLHAIPKRYIKSPSTEFHEYVARTATKHAYRSAAVNEVVKNKPRLSDQGSLFVWTMMVLLALVVLRWIC